MKRIITMFMLVCLLGSMMVGCGTSEVTFKTFTPEDNSFSVDFPGEPKLDTKPVSGLAGKMTIELFTLEEKSIAYNVGRTEIPKELLNQDLDALMTSVCNGAVSSTGGTNSKIEEITVDGHAGKYLTYNAPTPEGKTLKIHEHVVLIDNIIYEIQVINDNDDDDKYKENREKFFSSFKVTK
ncbi:PsbP-related protein [Tepidibacter mesophilus]|uniref:PsbP-related protein n=1 Tax=Tepidibacter mesophilus TaxID=655607 RepID=UPI000C071DAD|nr:PsbP-related protein [Tepidibacter mesophilus]